MNERNPHGEPMPTDDSTLTDSEHVAAGDPPGFTLARIAAPLVPSSRRREWLAEWKGELAWVWRDAERLGQSSLLTRVRHQWRALGAISDALWLRRRHSPADLLSLDVRYAARSLRRRPGFVSVVILTMALGIGATTAIFSVVNGVLLRPLGFPEPERLVVVQGAAVGGNHEKVSPIESYPDYLDLRAQSSSFASLGATRGATVTHTAPGADPARLRANFVTSNFLRTLGVQPVIGRDFVEEDDTAGAPRVAILSNPLWKRRFGSDHAVLGSTIHIDGVAAEIVGVMPPDVRLLGETQLWLPLVPGPLEQERAVHRLTLVGRLEPDVTINEAATEARIIAARLEQQYPESNAGRSATVRPLQDAIVADAKPALLILLGAVGLVLLIGCTNLASLFLVRAAAREREMAVRTALGASRGRLVGQWMAESLLLTLAGATAALFVAWFGMRALLRWVPRTIPRADEVALDVRVLAFLLVVSVVAGLVFGLLPALSSRGEVPLDRLRDGARGATIGRGHARLRHSLVLSEVALATVLMVGAALLVKSFWLLQSVDPGFQPDGVVVTRIQLPESRYESAADVIAFYERLHSEVATLPGVRSVSFAMEHPLSEGWTSSYMIAGQPRPVPGLEPESRIRPAWPGYFSTVGLPLLHGRDIADGDHFGNTGAVVVNEAFVRRHFSSAAEAIGQVIDRGQAWWPEQSHRFEIVGVVADEPFMGVRRPAEPATYYSHRQFPTSELWLVVRADCAAPPVSCEPAALARTIRDRIWRVDADLPIDGVHTMRELLHESVHEPRFSAALLTVFALVALLLAAVGIYGVLSYTVAQRTGEIGIRMALGAGRAGVVRLVVGQGLVVALVGVVIGLLGAVAMGRMLSSMLVGVSDRDPLIFGSVAGFLALVAAFAAWLPARRASRVEPVLALRAD